MVNGLLTKGNEFLTKIWSDEELRWKILIILVGAGCSILCGLLTQNIILTAIYIGITALIDIISAIESKMAGLISWEKIIRGLFKKMIGSIQSLS